MAEAEIEKAQGEEKAEAAQVQATADFEVDEDNWDSWLFFLQVDTQWLYVSVQIGWRLVARRAGMNYTGVQSGAVMAGWPRKRWPRLFEDLRLIEEAVLKADAEQQAMAN